MSGLRQFGMRFLKIIPTNLLRHKVRTLIGAAGITFGVAAMLSILSIVQGAIGMFERILSTDSHCLVFERNVSDLFFSSVPESAADELRQWPEVSAVNPVLFGIVSTPGHPVITCFGIASDDPRLDKATWKSGERKSFGDIPGTVYLGARAASFMEARQGAEVIIGAKSFVVGGILGMENGFEDGGVFMPLSEACRFFHKEKASSILSIRLHDEDGVAAFKKRVEAAYPGLSALENRDFSSSYNSFRILQTTSWAVGICAFVLGGMGVANTMLMSVMGRIREIAILRVNGFSELQIGIMIIAEALFIAGIGLMGGFAVGFGALSLLPHIPQFQGYVQASIGAGSLLGIVVTALCTAVAGAIYPAVFATRIQPAEALRYE